MAGGRPEPGTAGSVSGTCLPTAAQMPREWAPRATGHRGAITGHCSQSPVRSSEGPGGPAPASQPAGSCTEFHPVSFLPKRKPSRFNQLFIWKYLTGFFSPVELFDIIVLRVRIKGGRKIKTCDSGGHGIASIPGKDTGLLSRRRGS